ncbi:hypothetical protein GCM10027515_07770 [Schumannella luteola]|uniref:DUF308 domain-containing protein n=1 Tax=Schumannella luteola TaxID=472059 RepID=A0A852Y704_9MICO|nr:hypothetical protein [Schumannella luteola]NYG98093.1 hypothetical protein [Schumannella luteola]TPX01816.1 hypothetical protein FJ656_25860 [Schumannella luteola]
MSETSSARTPLWLIPVARAIPVLLLGLAITFTGGHSAGFGAVAFGLWGVVSTIPAVLVLIRPDVAGAQPVAARRALLGVIVLTAVVGIVALMLGLTAGGAGFGILVGVWGIVAGALEIFGGIRSRRDDPERTARLGGIRDAVIVGALTIALGVVALAIPVEFRQPFPGAGGQPGVLTASIIVVGALGAWGILVGVLHAIGAVSLREPRPAAATIGRGADAS